MVTLFPLEDMEKLVHLVLLERNIVLEGPLAESRSPQETYKGPVLGEGQVGCGNSAGSVGVSFWLL